ncbi:MAG: histidine phosphatase family protein [Myxococcales bacterium]|nr:histidine phosphatase family protein [Myxococcales bacterium]
MQRRPKNKTVLAMVGLPARGKSFMARKMARYLNWRGHRTRVFNVGSYRREHLGAKKDHRFFDPDQREAREARRKVALDALDAALGWVVAEGDVAVFDACNITRDRRDEIRARCRHAGVDLCFVETICDDPAVIEENIRATKLKLPDYEGLDPEDAARDFRMRIAHYRRLYQPLDDESSSFVKLMAFKGGGRRVVVNRVDEDPTLRAAQLLLSFQSRERDLWLVRHGESTHNVAGRIGGDAPLSDRGRAFAGKLGEWLAQQDKGPVEVWTSTLVRTRQTAEIVSPDHTPWRALDEIDAGVCDGMTYAEIAEQMPDVHEGRKADKLRYRYPRGESYLDVIQRLDPLIGDLERVTEPLLIIAHQAVLRALYAYLMGHPREEAPFLEIPLHTVIELAPGGHLPTERRHPLVP